ncbi:hypothetical protein FY036_20930 [Mesorhizobium microcysteis]|uniref:Uncharacterized protein n=1 Tax=Neoaquamicrobium microcysteis TaxID=2682781 RepID=A0A5D4GKF5_9HYPH|nr:hypothetical protein [Mesorhizobium microcysteis]TYR29346.1 hypothetical protein FY036_20930 [Mesorhizobium microcysteis]
MAKSALERKRLQLQREQERLRKRDDSTYPFLKEPFFKWLNRTDAYGDWSSGSFHLDASQINVPQFEDDSGPRSVDGHVELLWENEPEEGHYAGFRGSIGRAECMVDDLLAAAASFALAINTYKKEQINARIAETEQSDLSDPDLRKKAFADVVRLRKMLDRLEKMTRTSVYEYKIKDI